MNKLLMSFPRILTEVMLLFTEIEFTRFSTFVKLISFCSELDYQWRLVMMNFRFSWIFYAYNNVCVGARTFSHGNFFDTIPVKGKRSSFCTSLFFISCFFFIRLILLNSSYLVLKKRFSWQYFRERMESIFVRKWFEFFLIYYFGGIIFSMYKKSISRVHMSWKNNISVFIFGIVFSILHRRFFVSVGSARSSEKFSITVCVSQIPLFFHFPCPFRTPDISEAFYPSE